MPLPALVSARRPPSAARRLHRLQARVNCRFPAALPRLCFPQHCLRERLAGDTASPPFAAVVPDHHIAGRSNGGKRAERVEADGGAGQRQPSAARDASCVAIELDEEARPRVKASSEWILGCIAHGGDIYRGTSQRRTKDRPAL